VGVDHLRDQRGSLFGSQQAAANRGFEDRDRRRSTEPGRAGEHVCVVVVGGDDVTIGGRDRDRRRLTEVPSVARPPSEGETDALDINDRQRADRF
jgi:hypothetical protein